MENSKKNQKLLHYACLLFLGGAIAFQTSCKKNGKLKPKCDGSNVTYTNTVKTIIDNSCVSCHSGYSTYSGISTITSNGNFEKHVLKKQDMPDGSSLSQDQLNKLQCWLESGYPEN